MSDTKSLALYFHIPFCETICSFCPFTRGKFRDISVIEDYVQSLIKEVELKSKHVDFKSTPVQSIFFGGGTPSLLNPEQITRIGNVIKEHFDLSEIREFSFEIEVKSLTEDKAKALKDIGVTHPRFGLQTFNKRYREAFTLSASIEQIKDAVDLLKSYFEYQSFDILYGMSGQDEEELIQDLEQAVALGTTNIDIYPIDNIMTQVSLHKHIESNDWEPTSAMRKFNMNILVDKIMRSSGFMPHNGHGYFRTKVTDEVVSKDYSFVYHEHVYGHSDYNLLGFGVNAISSLKGRVVTNTQSKNKYREYLSSDEVSCHISEHDITLDYSKPLILHLPYHGEVNKGLIDFDKIHKTLPAKLKDLIQEDLIKEEENKYVLTKLGWYWYVNIIYYLMPKDDQLVLNDVVVQRLKDKGRNFTKKELLYPTGSTIL